MAKRKHLPSSDEDYLKLLEANPSYWCDHCRSWHPDTTPCVGQETDVNVPTTLELKCETCGGKGTVPSNRFTPGAIRDKCGACAGTGYIPTPEGERLLAFIRRHA